MQGKHLTSLARLVLGWPCFDTPFGHSALAVTGPDRAGTQHWRVTASSPEEALEKHKRGQSDFEFEEVEVTALGEPEIIEEGEIE